MKKSTFFLLILIFIGLLLGSYALYHEMKGMQQPSTIVDEAMVEVPVVQSDLILITPLENTVIASPVTITGKLRGGWFFEGVLPIEIIDGNGTVIGRGPAQATTEWTTMDYVSFISSIAFEMPTTTKGFILIKNDNPSGLPEKEKSYAIPVMFQ